jgi:agmatine deiminase
MISDAQSNRVYFSQLLEDKPQYAAFSMDLKTILDKHRINYGFLPETLDIWCRDYMPAQTKANSFVQYRYEPDYLLSKKYRRTKTYPDLVCDRIGIQTCKTNIILDGGNIVKSKNKVIMTDKIIPENSPHFLKAELLSELRKLFEVDEIVFIPWFIEDEFGHSDGILRFIDEDHVLVDGYHKLSKSAYSEKLYKVLKMHHLKPVELNFNVQYQSNKNWGYLNFLQMENLLLIPQFGIDEDEQALEQFKQYYPDYAAKSQIESIDASVLIKDGGVLNCASWNILDTKDFS